MSCAAADEIDDLALNHGMNPTVEECFRHCPSLMFSTILTSLGGILIGFDIAVLNGILIMPAFIKAMGAQNLDGKEWADVTSRMTSSLLLGAALSAPFAAPLADSIGRKRCICISLLAISSGGSIQTGATSQLIIILGRVVVGLAIGLLSSIVPLYLAEISPKSIRGSVISLFQVMIAIGILLAFLITLLFNNLNQNPNTNPHSDSNSDSNWRFILGIQAVMPLGLFFFAITLPESPRWLIKKGELVAAKKILTSTRWNQPVGRKMNCDGEWIVVSNIDIEFQNMCHDDSSCEGNESKWYNFLPLFDSSVLLCTFNGVAINILGQLTGFNSIIYYSSIIFETLGISADKTTATIGAINVLSTFMSLFLIDRFGRRILIVYGSISMCICLFIVAGIVLTIDPTQYPLAAQAIAVFISLFIVSFAYSYGPISWLYPAEIFPKNVRTKGVSLSTCAGWLTNFAVNQSVPYMILPGSTVGGVGGTFLFFAFWTLFMIPWALAHIHETNNMTLEDINDIFKVKTFHDYIHFIKKNLSYVFYHGDKSMREFTKIVKSDNLSAENENIEPVRIIKVPSQNTLASEC